MLEFENDFVLAEDHLPVTKEKQEIASLLATEQQHLVADLGWVQQLQQLLKPMAGQKKNPIKLYYLLSLQDWHNGKSVFVKLILDVAATNSKHRQFEDFLINNPDSGKNFTEEQQVLLAELLDNYHIARQNNNKHQLNFTPNNFPLISASSGKILKAMLLTGQCYWQKIADKPLSLSGVRKSNWCWQINADGSQTLRCNTQSSSIILPVKPIFYLDVIQDKVGRVKTGLPIAQALALLQIPPVPYHKRLTVEKLIQSTVGKTSPIPKAHNLLENHIKNISPQPHLWLFGDDLQRSECIGFAKLEFKYQQHMVQLSNPNEEIVLVSEAKLDIISRDLHQEQSYIELESPKISSVTTSILNNNI